MEEQEQDVNVESSATNESVTPEVANQEQAVEGQQEVKATTEVAPVRETAPIEAVDEMGVPLKNRLAEAQRKLKELDVLKQEIQQLKQVQTQQTQPTTPKYTAEELRAFAASAEYPEHRQWALEQLDKVAKEEQTNLVRQEIERVVQQQNLEQVKSRVFNEVTTRNPDIILKDAGGKFLGFNPQSPMFQRISFYMQNPEIGNHPQGLEIAEKFAAWDLNNVQKPVIQQKVIKQAEQLKSLQKKVFVEGSGNNATVTQSPRQAAIERVKQTGKGSEDAMALVLKDMGLLRE